MCFKNVIMNALSYEKIKKDLQRMSKIRPFLHQYNYKEINFPSGAKEEKKLNQTRKPLLLRF